MDREDWIVSLAFRNLVSVDSLEQLGEKFLDWKFDIKMILEALKPVGSPKPVAKNHLLHGERETGGDGLQFLESVRALLEVLVGSDMGSPRTPDER